MEKSQDDLWKEYALLQDRIDRAQVVNHRTFAMEDQLNVFLDSLEKGVLLSDPNSRRTRIENLYTNRSQKYRHRYKLLGLWAPNQPQFTSKSPIDELIREEQLARACSMSTPQDWRILCRLADEDDYAIIAKEEGLRLGTLKSRVSRCRNRIKASMHIAA